jgi:3-hydroxyacyl-[acyl-carrier-protein] dehydratase
MMNDFLNILNFQKNRYPMLFIDRILECHPGKSVVTLKNFTYNEWYFPVHFEDEAVVPGFVVMETMLQSFILTFLSIPEYQGMQTADTKIELFKIEQKLVPGDTLVLRAELDSFKRGVACGSVIGTVNEIEVCSLTLEVVIPKITNQFRVENK